MMLASIRWRLQAWHGLILVVVLAGFGLTAFQVAERSQLARIDQDLEQRAMALLRPGPHGPMAAPPDGPFAGGRGPGDGDLRARLLDGVRRADSSEQSGEGGGFYYVVWDADGAVLLRSANSPADVPPPERQRLGAPREPGGTHPPDGRPPDEPPPFGPGPRFQPPARTRGDLREHLHFHPGGLALAVGRSIAEDRAAMRRLAYGLAAAGATVLLLGLAGGWWLATRAIRPIKDISATAVRIANGDLSQRINTAGTDDELGRLAGVLNATFARLEAAFAQQAQFTSDASHELRTPLAVILSQTQTALTRERSAAEYREALEACQRAAERMRRLSESLLQLARLDAGEERMARVPLDLARVARECLELVRPLALARGVDLRWELPTVHCHGDAERLAQVVMNLLTNAIDFNHDGGQVRVATQIDRSQAVLTVADTGVGIGVAELPRVFERFYRVDRARTSGGGRTGLGLAIAKAIVDAHSGTLTVASTLGVGSTFTLRLPLE